MRFDTESTICAIATGAEGAFRGAIRVTGPDSLSIVAKTLDHTDDVHWNVSRATRLVSSIDLPLLGTVDVAAFVWPDGRSYTGQPSVELHCPGNIQILQSIQARLIENGAILAQPGEFTLRAFLAGRLDLTQCEAVLGVIHASNDRSLGVALSQLAGGLAEPLAQLRTTLVNLLADIEAGLDFVDEDISFISQSQITERLEQSLDVVREMLRQMESRAGQTVQLQVSIVGPPNAGKSSFINAIAKQPISIVSSEPGTTRDYVRLRLNLESAAIDILDTAGLESVEGTTPRALAQGFTQKQIENADLILYCMSVDDAESSEWEFESRSGPIWLIRTKCDLAAIERNLSQHYDVVYSISTKHSESIDRVLKALSDWVATKMESFNQVVPLTAARCQASLNNALLALANAKEAAEFRLGDEVIASEIRLSLDEIGLVAGTVYTDDILDALFSRFCIGK